MILIAQHLAVLILLHAPGGIEIWVNPDRVTSMHGRTDNNPNKHFADKVECVVSLVDGKFVSVIEHCDQVRQKIEEAK